MYIDTLKIVLKPTNEITAEDLKIVKTASIENKFFIELTSDIIASFMKKGKTAEDAFEVLATGQILEKTVNFLSTFSYLFPEGIEAVSYGISELMGESE